MTQTNLNEKEPMDEQPQMMGPKMDHERIQILSSMKIQKAIWKLAIPTMLAMLIQTIYNMTDTFFIGQLREPNMVAAISICMPIAFLLQAFGNIFAIGGASLISRLLGEGEMENASHAASISFWSALTIMIATTILGMIYMEPILRLCGASDATMPFCKDYLFWMMLGAPFMGMQMAMGGLLRSEGATKESMVGMMSGSILNIILDPIFILFLNMGIMGAALATTIGNLVAFIYFIMFYVRKKGIISISPRLFVFDGHYYAAIFKIGVPASIGMVLMSVGFIFSNVYAASFGDIVVASYGVVMRITNIAIMMAMGLAQGVQPLMGYNYGAKRFDRLFETIRRSIKVNVLMATAFAVLFYIFADVWIRVFIDVEDVVTLGKDIMRIQVFGMPFMGMQMILMIMFQSLGKSVQSLIISLGRQGLFFIPAIIIFSAVWGLTGFIWALPFADMFTTALSFTLFLFMRKDLNRQMETGKFHATSLRQ